MKKTVKPKLERETDIDPRLLYLKDVAASKKDVVAICMCDPPQYGFKPPANIKNLLKTDELGDSLHYPEFQGKSELLEGLTRRIKDITGMKLEKDNIVITNGVSGTFHLLGMVSSKTGNILIQKPFYYPMKAIFSYHTKTAFYPCVEEDAWNPDMDNLRKTLELDSLIKYLTTITPNNPTGAVYPPKILKDLVNIAGEYNLILVTNEIYDEFTTEPFTSVLKMSKDVPTLYLNGFSKTYRLPGIRVGYMAFHDPEGENSDHWNKIMNISRVGLGVNSIGQLIALEALKETQEERKKIFKRLWDQREALTKRIEVSPVLDAQPSKGGTYIFVRVPVDDYKLAERLLMNEGFFVYPGSAFGSKGKSYLSLVFLETVDNLNRGINAVEKVITELQ